MRTSELVIHAFRIVLCLDTEAKPLIVTPKPRPIGQGGGGGGGGRSQSNVRERVHHLL